MRPYNTKTKVYNTTAPPILHCEELLALAPPILWPRPPVLLRGGIDGRLDYGPRILQLHCENCSCENCSCGLQAKLLVRVQHIGEEMSAVSAKRKSMR